MPLMCLVWPAAAGLVALLVTTAGCSRNAEKPRADRPPVSTPQAATPQTSPPQPAREAMARSPMSESKRTPAESKGAARRRADHDVEIAGGRVPAPACRASERTAGQADAGIAGTSGRPVRSGTCCRGQRTAGRDAQPPARRRTDAGTARATGGLGGYAIHPARAVRGRFFLCPHCPFPAIDDVSIARAVGRAADGHRGRQSRPERALCQPPADRRRKRIAASPSTPSRRTGRSSSVGRSRSWRS